jgi:hypothetical protein
VNHFEVTVEDGTRYTKGEGKHLGHPLGPQAPLTLNEVGGFLVIGFDGGARVRIPMRRVTEILEG